MLLAPRGPLLRRDSRSRRVRNWISSTAVYDRHRNANIGVHTRSQPTCSTGTLGTTESAGLSTSIAGLVHSIRSPGQTTPKDFRELYPTRRGAIVVSTRQGCIWRFSRPNLQPSVKRASLVAILALCGSPHLFAQISPGPLSKPHAFLNGPTQCSSCHETGQGTAVLKCR